MDKLNLGDKVWMMISNKAVEVTIVEIVKTQKLVPAINEVPDSTSTDYKIWASINISYNNNIQLFEGKFFNSKEALIQSL